MAMRTMRAVMSDLQLTANRLSRERKAIEQGLLPHLVWCMADQMRRQGWVLREDMLINLSRAGAAALAGFSEDDTIYLARRIDEAASGLLRDQSFDDPRTGLLACCYFVLKLVTERLIEDPHKNQAVLVATVLMEDETDRLGELPGHQPQMEKAIGSMLIRIRLQGLYTKTIENHTPNP